MREYTKENVEEEEAEVDYLKLTCISVVIQLPFFLLKVETHQITKLLHMPGYVTDSNLMYELLI